MLICFLKLLVFACVSRFTWWFSPRFRIAMAEWMLRELDNHGAEFADLGMANAMNVIGEKVAAYKARHAAGA